MSMFDENLLAWDGDTVAVTDTSDAIDLRGTPAHGMAAKALIGASAGAAATALLSVEASDDNVTYAQIAADDEEKTGPNHEIVVPFQTDMRYVKLKLTVAGTGSLAAVTGGVILNCGREWKRIGWGFPTDGPS